LSQVGLDVRPIETSSDGPLIEIEVGLRTNENGELEFFGIEEADRFISEGFQLQSILPGNALLEKTSESDDSASLILMGSSVKVALSAPS